jgi:hypothetical protein
MNNIENWDRAILLLNTMIDEKIEIYEVMRIFTPMATKSRRRLLYCDPNITSQDLDEVEKAIRRYKETMTEISQTKVETRIKRSSFFKTLQEHYDKNKNKK